MVRRKTSKKEKTNERRIRKPTVKVERQEPTGTIEMKSRFSGSSIRSISVPFGNANRKGVMETELYEPDKDGVFTVNVRDYQRCLDAGLERAE